MISRERNKIKFHVKKAAEKAVSVFSESNQKKVAIEELQELALAVLHFDRGKASVEDILTEIADVRIMIEQLQMIFEISEDDVLHEMQKKAERLEYKIERYLKYNESY